MNNPTKINYFVRQAAKDAPEKADLLYGLFHLYNAIDVMNSSAQMAPKEWCLNVLKDYKFDVLKIDMKFLSAFETNPKSKDIIQCVIDLANKIGMKTLTEGVETKDQAEFLNMVGCGRLQGYLFGKPIPQDELDSQIKNGKYIVSKTIL